MVAAFDCPCRMSARGRSANTCSLFSCRPFPLLAPRSSPIAPRDKRPQSIGGTIEGNLQAAGCHPPEEMIASDHDEILTTIYRQTHSSDTELINFLTTGVALVHVRFSLEKAGESFFPGVAQTSSSIVALKNPGSLAS